jgi:hypothetical protein
MFKASLLSLALVLAFTAAPSARTFDDMSGAKKTTHASAKSGHHKYARGRRAPAAHAGGQQGEDACHGDAVRLCKPYLGQGDMVVLSCFKSRANRLSRGCRALLQGYGQL